MVNKAPKKNMNEGLLVLNDSGCFFCQCMLAVRITQTNDKLIIFQKPRTDSSGGHQRTLYI